MTSAPRTPATTGLSLTARSRPWRRGGSRAARTRGPRRRRRPTGRRSRCPGHRVLDERGGDRGAVTLAAQGREGGDGDDLGHVPERAQRADGDRAGVVLDHRGDARARLQALADRGQHRAGDGRLVALGRGLAAEAGPGRAEADLLDGECGAQARVVARPGTARAIGRARGRLEHEQRHLDHRQRHRAEQRRCDLVHPREVLWHAQTRAAVAHGLDVGGREVVRLADPWPRVVRPRLLRDEQRKRADLLEPRAGPRPGVEEGSIALSRRCTPSRSGGTRAARRRARCPRCRPTGTPSRRRGRARPPPARR